MSETIKRIGLSIGLIIICSALLLWSDRHNYHNSSKLIPKVSNITSIAVLQLNSSPVVQDINMGIFNMLEAKGFVDGGNLAVKIYNPENDLPTANLMAQKIISGNYRVAISITTLMLQTLANANRSSHVTHVFGGVTSPVISGVGINALDSLDKPAYLTGIGTMPPVKEIFKIAKQLNPKLEKVGVVWNTAEINSEFATKQAREISTELGITLIEAPIEQTKDIREAAQSLVARGIDAIWTGGDATVNTNIHALIEVANTAKIPLFSNYYGHSKEGGLFDYGSDYNEVGKQVGVIIADILNGKDPSTIAVQNYTPEKVILNEQVRKSLRDRWVFTPDLYKKAQLIIDETSKVNSNTTAISSLTKTLSINIDPNKHYKIGLAYFAPEPGIDSVLAGLNAKLKLLGLEEGKNLSFKTMHAQGEIAQISTLGQVLDSSDVDAILTLTTPVLQGVGMMAKHKPVVFTYVTDPIAAGAGKSFTEHLPHLTGIGSFPPIEDMLTVTQKVLPKIHKIGTLYNPSEVNSVKVASVMRDLCKQKGLELIEAPINTTADAVQAAQSLAAQNVEAILSVSDNTMYQALDAITNVATKNHIPVVLDQPEFISHEALMVVGVDYKESGTSAAEPLAQILTGTNPASIPFRNVSKKVILLNDKVAKNLNIVFPDEVRGMVK